MKNFILFALLVLLLTAVSPAQVYRLAEMNTDQIRALDRQKTVVLMPGGVIEQHGPYLPAFTDGFMNEWWTARLAEAITARSGWSVVIFPMIPLGDGGANEIGGKFNFPGSYGIRVKTLRAVYMDLGTELGEQGFKWIFVIQNHGSPMHNQALDQAGDFFHDTYGGQMVNLYGLAPEKYPAEPALPEANRRENGIDLHAGASETSRVLFIRPELVSPAYLKAVPFTASSFPELGSVAAKNDWLGYFGSPRLATADFGRSVMEYRAKKFNDVALKILDGLDSKSIPRFAVGAIKEEGKMSFAYDEKVETRQNDWLKKKGID